VSVLTVSTLTASPSTAGSKGLAAVDGGERIKSLRNYSDVWVMSSVPRRTTSRTVGMIICEGSREEPCCLGLNGGTRYD
jgi:hypothetical protein